MKFYFYFYAEFNLYSVYFNVVPKLFYSSLVVCMTSGGAKQGSQFDCYYGFIEDACVSQVHQDCCGFFDWDSLCPLDRHEQEFQFQTFSKYSLVESFPSWVGNTLLHSHSQFQKLGIVFFYPITNTKSWDFGFLFPIKILAF